MDCYSSERVPFLDTKPSFNLFTQTASSVIASLATFNTGSMLGWSSPALANYNTNSTSSFVRESNLTWLPLSCMIGLLLGSLVVGFAIKTFGRRLSLMILAIPCFIGWIMIALSRNIAWLALGRIITGICGGGFIAIVPVYISEIADDSVRGRLALVSNVMLSLGIVYSYAIGSLVSWQWLSVGCAFFPVLLFLGSLFYLRETPVYLIEKQRIQDAYEVLTWLYGHNCPHNFLQAKLREISLAIDTTQNGSFASLLEVQNRKPILISMALFACQQLCGVNAIIFYLTEIFTLSGSNIGADLAAILVAVTQTVFAVLSALAIDKLGRKLLMILSQAGMSISCVILGLYFFLIERNNGMPLDGLGWIPEISLIFYIAAYNIGAAPLAWLMSVELCPNHLRGITSSFLPSFCWLLALVVVATFPVLLRNVGASTIFWGYAVLTTTGCFFSKFCLPETKGKSFRQINMEFFGNA